MTRKNSRFPIASWNEITINEKSIHIFMLLLLSYPHIFSQHCVEEKKEERRYNCYSNIHFFFLPDLSACIWVYKAHGGIRAKNDTIFISHSYFCIYIPNIYSFYPHVVLCYNRIIITSVHSWVVEYGDWGGSYFFHPYWCFSEKEWA